MLTLSFRQARAAAIFSAAIRLVAVAINVIFSGQWRVNSHFFSFPPVVLIGIISCKVRYRELYRIEDLTNYAYLSFDLHH